MSGGIEYKNSFFRDMFGLDEGANARFLDAVNAVFDTNFTLENTKINDVSLDNVFYTKLRNDVAKIVNGQLIVLIEHQSTINENLPLRMLEYVSETYINILEARNRYKAKLQKIPRPLFVVFYNGKGDFPNEKTLHLSDAFLNDGKNEVMLELAVRVINVSLSKNCDILKKSSSLFSYSTLCNNIAQSQAQNEKDYVRDGIKKTIDMGILVDYLKKNITEVIGMVRAEYDYDTDMAVKGEENWEAGYAAAVAEKDKEISRMNADNARMSSDNARLNAYIQDLQAQIASLRKSL